MIGNVKVSQTGCDVIDLYHTKVSTLMKISQKEPPALDAHIKIHSFCACACVRSFARAFLFSSLLSFLPSIPPSFHPGLTEHSITEDGRLSTRCKYCVY